MIIAIWVYAFGTSMVPLLPSFNGYVLYKWSLSCILDLSATDGYKTKYYTTAYNTITVLITGTTITWTQVATNPRL